MRRAESRRLASVLPAAGASSFALLRCRAVGAINFRIANGCFTERSLARMARLSQTHVHHVLSDQREGSLRVLDALCVAAGVELAALWGIASYAELAEPSGAWWRVAASIG